MEFMIWLIEKIGFLILVMGCATGIPIGIARAAERICRKMR